MVLSNTTIQPLLLCVSVYGFLDAERGSMQVAIFIIPCTPNEEPLYKDFEKPDKFVPISFPRVIRAFPSETLRLEVQGSSFEPDTSLGEDDLVSFVEIQQKHNEVHTKWIKLNSSMDEPLSGKMKVSSRQGNSQDWEMVAHINLSTRTTYTASSPSEQV